MGVTRLRRFVPAAERRVRAMREAAQLVLELPLRDHVRDGLIEAVGDFTDRTAPRPWDAFVKLSKPQARFIGREIQKTAKPAITHRVWWAALTFVEWDTGVIEATRQRLATEADTTPEEVSRALGALVEIGALTRETHGKRRQVYKVNADVAWCGREEARIEVAATQPRFRVVEPAG